MKTYTCSAGAMMLQMYAAQKIMAEMMQDALDKAEREGFDVEWFGPDVMVRTEKEQNNG